MTVEREDVSGQCLYCGHEELKKSWAFNDACCEHCGFVWTTNDSTIMYSYPKSGSRLFSPQGCLAVFAWEAV